MDQLTIPNGSEWLGEELDIVLDEGPVDSKKGNGKADKQSKKE